MQHAQGVLNRFKLAAGKVFIAAVCVLALHHLSNHVSPIGIQRAVGSSVLDQLGQLVQNLGFLGLQRFHPFGVFRLERFKFGLKRQAEPLHGVAGRLQVRVYGGGCHNKINP